MDKKILFAIVIVIIAGSAFLLFKPKAPVDNTNDNGGGDQPPEPPEEQPLVFEIIDGEKVSLDDLLSEGKPLLLYFFTTWCPTCKKDLENLNETYADYKEDVNVLVVGFGPTENEAKLRDYKDRKNYIWPFALYNKEAITRLKIVTQASKVGFYENGDTAFSEGFGVVGIPEWRDFLDQLAAGVEGGG
jgi:thiol-disulfide isomerase/thioredoxin